MEETREHSRTDRARSVVVGWIGAGLVLGTLAVMAGYLRINFEGGSAPPGIYLARRGQLVRGGWVAVCLPETLARFGSLRGYLDAGSCPGGVRSVGKKVAALAGDTVQVSPEGLSVNGRRVTARRRDHDSAGRHLPRVPEGRYTVPPGQAWLISTHHARSWDSRYYGPVPLEPDRARVLVPLWSSEETAPDVQTSGPGGS